MGPTSVGQLPSFEHWSNSGQLDLVGQRTFVTHWMSTLQPASSQGQSRMQVPPTSPWSSSFVSSKPASFANAISSSMVLQARAFSFSSGERSSKPMTCSSLIASNGKEVSYKRDNRAFVQKASRPWLIHFPCLPLPLLITYMKMQMRPFQLFAVVAHERRSKDYTGGTREKTSVPSRGPPTKTKLSSAQLGRCRFIPLCHESISFVIITASLTGLSRLETP